MQFFAITFAILVFCCLQSSFAIKCYKCRSWTDPDCSNDKFNKARAIVDCDTEVKPNAIEQYLPVTKCSKIVSRDVVGEMVTRGCHWEIVDQKENSCFLSHNRQIVSCNICHNELCNDSVGVTHWT